MIFAAGKERMRCVTTPWAGESMGARSAIADKAAVSVVRNMPFWRRVPRVLPTR
jgi:hypothetical protein